MTGGICRIVICAFFFHCMLGVYGQKNQSLEKVRQEIEQLGKDLRTKEAREKLLIEQREDADREIGLKRKLLHTLEQENRNTQRRIQQTGIELDKASQSYNNLQELVGSRLVTMYKRGRMADWKILFNLSSWNQAKVWLRYQKRIVEMDQRNLRLLQEKEKTIQEQRNVLERDLRKQDDLLQEERKETESMESKKEERDRLIALVQQDKQAIEEKKRRKEQSLVQIRGQIRIAEEKRRTATQTRGGAEFASMKGRLDWPVAGEILTKYGVIKNVELNIEEENIGIEIEAVEEATVRSVYSGKANFVEWMRTMGYIVILDHGGGYYTVYGHLDMVFIEESDEVNVGQVIGRVGDNNGMNGSTLHFEIWNSDTHFNPQGWLRQ